MADGGLDHVEVTLHHEHKYRSGRPAGAGRSARPDGRRREADGPVSDDPDLTWTAPVGPDLPYDGDVPAEVRRLAARRRSTP